MRGVEYGDGFVGAIIKIYMNEWKSGCKKGFNQPKRFACPRESGGEIVAATWSKYFW